MGKKFNQQEQKNWLQFFIKINKKNYLLNEVIDMEIGLQNLGNEPIVVNRRFNALNERDEVGPFEVFVRAKGENPDQISNYILDFRWHKLEPDRVNFTTLIPSQQVVKLLRITDFFGFNTLGKVIVFAEYNNRYSGSEYGLSAWTGKLEAEPLEFWITE